VTLSSFPPLILVHIMEGLFFLLWPNSRHIFNGICALDISFFWMVLVLDPKGILLIAGLGWLFAHDTVPCAFFGGWVVSDCIY